VPGWVVGVVLALAVLQLPLLLVSLISEASVKYVGWQSYELTHNTLCQHKPTHLFLGCRDVLQARA
jgi:hypothetical protein